VIGDVAAVRDEKGAMAPGVAPAAKQMGRYVGRLIAARVAGKSSPPPFRYRSGGELATIGRRAAVVKFGNLRLKGFVGWLFWSLAHIYFLIGVKNRFMVAFRSELATIGRRAAVVKFGNLRLRGFVGWLFWSLAHIYFLIGVKNRFIVAF